jgi:hypothetical protein
VPWPTTGRWLKGSTHVHALPSGDSVTEIVDVMTWYDREGYDFIVLTDHNRVSELDGGATAGQRAIATAPLIVISGVELTYNPDVCEPPPEPQHETKCKIHANLLGPTARPEGKQSWAIKDDPSRLASYAKAIELAKEWGAPLVQINHPRWFWAVDGALLTELGRRGATLVEINNKQFDTWNAGDATHASAEAIWDTALIAGVTMWGVASDDAHDYDTPGQYPAGGSYVVVWADPDAQSILDALGAGRFYASTGVTLTAARRDGADLLVEVADASPGEHTIRFVGDGQVLAEVPGRSARHPLDAASYVRAVVIRDDGAKAWVQPARR